LFDIDGTLVTVRGAGRAAFARALEEIYGTAGTIERFDFRGRTDLSIVHELMTEAGLDVERIRARVEDCFRVYARELTRIIGDGSRVQVLPGVAGVGRQPGPRPGAGAGRPPPHIEARATGRGCGPASAWPPTAVTTPIGDACRRSRASGREPSATSSPSTASRSSATRRSTSSARAAAARWRSPSRPASIRPTSWRRAGR